MPATRTYRPVSHYRLVLAASLCLCCLFPTIIHAQETAPPDSIEQSSLEERIRTFLRESVFQSLGIISGIASSDEYDTGMGFGANVSQILIEPAVRLKTTVYFWGAARDSVDVSTLGIEESLLLEKSPRNNLNFYSGITGGYYSMEKDTFHTGSSGEYSEESNENRFDIYLTSGFRYQYRTNRSLTLTLNYLVTRETNEWHLIAGLEFFKPLQQ